MRRRLGPHRRDRQDREQVSVRRYSLGGTARDHMGRHDRLEGTRRKRNYRRPQPSRGGDSSHYLASNDVRRDREPPARRRATSFEGFTVSPGTADEAVRYVDATDFGAHAVEWVLLVQGQGNVVLTVEGLPVARVEPLAGAQQLAQRRAKESS